MNRQPTLLEVSLILVGIYATLALVLVGASRLISWLNRRERRKAVQMIDPLPVAMVHLATAYRRDPLRVRRDDR